MKNFSKPYGALPNAFVTVNDLDIHNDVSILKKRSDLNINKFTSEILSYIKNNASIVGGCCEVGPQYIEAIRNKIFFVSYSDHNHYLQFYTVIFYFYQYNYN